MNYRRMGRSGLKLSELSLGAWVTYGGQVGQDTAEECMIAAWEHGVNFFDFPGFLVWPGETTFLQV